MVINKHLAGNKLLFTEVYWRDKSAIRIFLHQRRRFMFVWLLLTLLFLCWCSTDQKFTFQASCSSVWEVIAVGVCRLFQLFHPKKGTNVTPPWPSRIMADNVSQKKLKDEGPLGPTRCIPPSTTFKALSGTWVQFCFSVNIWTSPLPTWDIFDYRYINWGPVLLFNSMSGKPWLQEIIYNILLFYCLWRKKKNNTH